MTEQITFNVPRADQKVWLRATGDDALMRLATPADLIAALEQNDDLRGEVFRVLRNEGGERNGPPLEVLLESVKAAVHVMRHAFTQARGTEATAERYKCQLDAVRKAIG